MDFRYAEEELRKEIKPMRSLSIVTLAGLAALVVVGCERETRYITLPSECTCTVAPTPDCAGTPSPSPSPDVKPSPTPAPTPAPSPSPTPTPPPPALCYYEISGMSSHDKPAACAAAGGSWEKWQGSKEHCVFLVPGVILPGFHLTPGQSAKGCMK